MSWVEIKGNVVDDTKFEVNGNWSVAVNQSTAGALDLNAVWSESGGTGTHYEVTDIGPFAFQGCSSLTSIKMPNSVTSIGMFAFESCSGLTSINISNKVESIEQYSFSNCIKISSIIIPNSVTSIGSNAFAWCSGLTSLTLSSNVELIDEGAFRGCSGLTSIVIPSSVKSIGSEGFAYCSNLSTITSFVKNVFETGGEAFKSCDNATLYVPKGLVDAYRSTADWNRISKIVEMSNSYDVNSDGFIDISDVVALVNAILSSSTGDSYDVNADGSVDISDVVALVNMILGQ